MESANLVAAGSDGVRAEQLVERGIRLGQDTLHKIVKQAIERMAVGLSRDLTFNDEERGELIEAMASAFGSAELLGRAAVRDKVAQVLSRGELEPVATDLAESQTIYEELAAADADDFRPLPPERATAFFRGLVPTLGMNPDRFGADMRRRASTMAAATETQLLRRVQSTIQQRVATGQGISTAPQEINALLDAAGVSQRNPQYAEMVFRTNAMDAYNQAADDERRNPDVIEAFPVWQYSNPDDSRSRRDHADRNGNYYPASVPFVEVRGTGIEDAANCRCTPIPIDKREWAELRKKGKRIADGYPDVPGMEGGPMGTTTAQTAGERVKFGKSTGTVTARAGDSVTVDFGQDIGVKTFSGDAAAMLKPVRGRPKPSAEPAPQPATPHPLAGLSRDQAVERLVPMTGYKADVAAEKSYQQALLANAAADAAKDSRIASVVKSLTSQGGGQLASIPDIHAQIGGTTESLLGDLLRLSREGKIRLHPFTGAAYLMNKPEYVIPAGQEWKFYVGLD